MPNPLPNPSEAVDAAAGADRILAGRAFVGVGGLVVVTGVALALTLSSLRGQALRAGERLTESFAQIIAEQTTRAFQAVDQRLQLTAANVGALSATTDVDEQARRRQMQEEIKDLPFVRALSVVDRSGRIVYSSDLSARGLSATDRGYFQHHKMEVEKGFHIGQPVRGHASGEWLISASRALPSADGAFAGVIVAAVDPSYFDKLWRTVDVGGKGSLALFRRDGVLMTQSPFDDSLVGRSFPDLAVFRMLSERGPSGVFHADSVSDGGARIFGYRALPSRPDLVVVVGQPYEVVLSSWTQLATLAGVVWLVASLAVVGLSAFLNRTWLHRSRTEARVEQMAQRLVHATDAASIGVWDWDLKADRWYATPTYFAMLGYKPDQGVARRQEWLDHVHPEDRELVAANIRNALDGVDVPYRHDARVLHADGTFRWMSVIGRVLSRAETGKPTRLLGVMMDITESRQAEAALRESEAEFLALAGAMPQMVWTASPDGQVAFFNQQWMDYTGLTLDQSLGDGWINAFHPEERERARQAWRRTSGSLRAYSSEYRLRRADGVYRWWLIQARPTGEPHSKAPKWIGTCTDIQDQKLAQLEISRANLTLQRQQTELRVLFDVTPAMIWFKDTENRILRINERAAVTAGKTVEEIEGKPSIEIYPHDAARFFAEDQRVIESGLPRLGVVESVVDPSGREVWIRTDTVPYRDPDGKVIGIVVMAQDITEDKRAEERLRESEERFAGAFEHAPIGVALVSPDGRWLKVNRALCDLVGYSEAGLRSRTLLDIAHPLDREVDLGSLRDLNAGVTRSYQVEKRYLHADGHVITVLLNVSLVRDSRRQPRYFVAQIQDITQRKQSEAALESSLREKNGLLKEVHHRVKNNLQVITSLLRLESSRSRDAATKDVLKEMQGRIRSMALLHETLYRSGNFARVDLVDYLGQLATQLFRAQNPDSSRIRLEMDLSAVRVGIDQAIPCGLIVNELLTNSLKHAFAEPRSGEVRLGLGQSADGLAWIRVSDTGAGLPADFDARRGKSLGLQLANDLARQIGGHFEVAHTGVAIFTVTFPPQPVGESPLP